MENVNIFHDHWEYFTSISYNLLPFGIVCGLLFFPLFGMLGPKNLATLDKTHKKSGPRKRSEFFASDSRLRLL
jgi:hypothetical protein